MAQKHVETLKTIEHLINHWKEGKVSETTALDDIYDVMESLSNWEEAEHRRRMREEMERNSITLKTTVRYMGKLPLSPIDFDEE